MPFSHMSAARAAKWGACALTALYLGWAATPVLAQKSGGTLRLFHRDSPASGSIHEEATISVVMPFSAVFNGTLVTAQALNGGLDRSARNRERCPLGISRRSGNH